MQQSAPRLEAPCAVCVLARAAAFTSAGAQARSALPVLSLSNGGPRIGRPKTYCFWIGVWCGHTVFA